MQRAQAEKNSSICRIYINTTTLSLPDLRAANQCVQVAGGSYSVRIDAENDNLAPGATPPTTVAQAVTIGTLNSYRADAVVGLMLR